MAAKVHKEAYKERSTALEIFLNTPTKDSHTTNTSSGSGAMDPTTNFADTLKSTTALTMNNLDTHNQTGSTTLLQQQSPPPSKTLHTRTIKSNGIAGHREGYYDGASAVTGMSVAKIELIQKAGNDAAIKLHTDPTLQKAELSRTKYLNSLRSHRKNTETNMNSKDDMSILRKKTKHNVKIEKRDITKDVDTMYLLNYWPKGCVLKEQYEANVRPASVYSSSTAADSNSGGAISARLTGTDAMVVDTSNSGNDSAAAPVNAADKAGQGGAVDGGLSRSQTQSLLLATSSSTGTGSGGKYKEVAADLWDYLIDCVVTISISRPKSQLAEKQRALLSNKTRRISAESLTLFDPSRTPLPAPSTLAPPTKPRIGTAPTPRTTRHTPGGYNSTTSMHSQMKQQSNLLEAKEKLQKVEQTMGPMYEEVYRRLVRIPVTSPAELEGDRDNSTIHGNAIAVKSHSYLRSLFERFDKNLNGYISKEEFKLAMNEMNIEVNSEDCDIFFNRFKGERPGNIDWKEFIRFFDTQSIGITSSTVSTKSNNIIQLLMQIKVILADIAKKMTNLKISTLESYLNIQNNTTTKGSNSSELELNTPVPGKISQNHNVFILPDHAFFQNITTATTQIKTNVNIMQKLGIQCTENEMARISRIFQCKVSVLMEFIYTPYDMNLYEILDIADREVSQGLSKRTGTGSTGTDVTSAIAKLWSSLAPNLSTCVSYETISQYFTTMLLEANVFDEQPQSQQGQGGGSPRDQTTTATPTTAATSEYVLSRATIRGVDAHILCRIISDTLVYSTWNRDAPLATTTSTTTSTTTNKKETTTSEIKTTLSFSGLDAYVRNNRINYIERKLKYLMQLEQNYSGAEVYMLIHVYISIKQDEIVILAYDPISSDIYKYSHKEDLKLLPISENLVELFIHNNKHNEIINKYMKNTTSIHYYNPWETPYQDNIITNIISRLRLIRSKITTKKSYLYLSEDSKFIKILKNLFDNTKTLPFFSIINELTLIFEINNEKLTSEMSIRSFIFTAIRKNIQLCSFLQNVNSSLNIILSTYNSGIRETLSWNEFLAHLNNYRNTFFTIELLPRFIEPEKYIYNPYEITEDNNSSDSSSDSSTVEANKIKSYVDYDGAPHPYWNTTYKFHFQPPQLTNCPVLSTEVSKIKINNQYKYVIIMVRLGKKYCSEDSNTGNNQKLKKEFKFLTIYDPRSSTDYQCGILKDCKLYDLLYPDSNSTNSNSSTNAGSDAQIDLITFMSYVTQASEANKIIIGPAITPRLEVSVFNDTGRKQELLGSCQVSVSSVLSGTGVSEKQRVYLTYKQEIGEGGRSIEASAGDIQLDMMYKGDLGNSSSSGDNSSNPTNTTSNKLKSKNTTNTTTSNNNKNQNTKSANINITGQIEDLKIENDSLLLETKKLKEKLNNSIKEINDLKSTDGSNIPNNDNEINQIKDEKIKIELEKNDLIKEIKRLEEEKKNEIQKIKNENVLMIQKLQENQQNTTNNTMYQEDYHKLQQEYEEMRLKLEKMQLLTDKTGTIVSDSMTSLPILHPSNSNIDLEYTSSTRNIGNNMIHIADDSLLGTVQSILKEFQTRHERKHATSAGVGVGGNALDSLQRLLNSYAKPDGSVTPKDIITALGDLMVGVSMEQATKLVREVGISRTGTVLVSPLMGYLNSELHQLCLARKQARRHTASAVRLSGDNEHTADSNRLRKSAEETLRDSKHADEDIVKVRINRVSIHILYVPT